MKNIPTLFLDNDGVLADFDKGCQNVFGIPTHEAEKDKSNFWKTLSKYENDDGEGFYQSLDLMPDAMVLYDAVKHLDPTILTGCPIGKWASAQKLRWRNKHFAGNKMITCLARDKSTYMNNDGDVLIDDTLKYKSLWEEAGGIFIHHTSAHDSIRALKEAVPIFFQTTDWWTPPKDHSI